MSVTSSQEEIKFPHPLGHVTKYIKFQLPFKALEMSDTWELDNIVLRILQSFICMITDRIGLHSVLLWYHYCVNNKMLESDCFLKALIHGLIWLLNYIKTVRFDLSDY